MKSKPTISFDFFNIIFLFNILEYSKLEENLEAFTTNIS